MTLAPSTLKIASAGAPSAAACKPGKPGKAKAYHVTVNLDESLKQGSVLVDLVAVDLVVEEVREVREQVEVGVNAEQLRGLRGPRAATVPRGRQAVPLRVAAIRVVDVTVVHQCFFCD